MLDMTSKKQKDRLGVITVLTLLFLSGAAPLYDAASADGVMYEPLLKPTQIAEGSIAPAKTYDVLSQIPVYSKLAGRIDELESKVESKEMQLAAVKEQKDIELQQQRETYVSMDQALIELSEYVGKTPYGFGDDPRRWDCSGLTLWFYKTYRGIDLHHSATDQMTAGLIVDAPIPGDLVAFKYGRSKSAFHIGVYMGGGLFIHAKNHSADTVLERVEDFASKNITVVYIRY